METSPSATWQALEILLNPDSPASLNLYVSPPQSFADDIAQDLQNQPGLRLKFLLIGPRGGGKSTELRKLGSLLEKTHLVSSIDLDRSGVSPLNVTAFDLLYLSGLVLLRHLETTVADQLYKELVQAYLDNSQEEIQQMGDRKTAIEGVAGFVEKAGDTLAAASLTAGMASLVGVPAGIAAAGASIAGSRLLSTGTRLLGPRGGLVPESSPRGQALQGVCGRIAKSVRDSRQKTPICILIDGLERMNGQAGERFREIFESTRLLANAPWSYTHV